MLCEQLGEAPSAAAAPARPRHKQVHFLGQSSQQKAWGPSSRGVNWQSPVPEGLPGCLKLSRGK